MVRDVIFNLSRSLSRCFNVLQSIVRKKVFQDLMVFVSILVIFILTILSVLVYGRVKAAEVLSNKLEINLAYLQRFSMGKIFIGDTDLFSAENKTLLLTRYSELMLMIEDLSKYEVKKNYLMEVMLLNAYVNVFLSMLPMLYNSPWSINFVFVFGSVVNLFAVLYEWSASFSLMLNLILCCLIFTFFIFKLIFDRSGYRRNE